MKTKDLDRNATLKAIEMLTKRIEFNNQLNRFVRKFMKERNLEKSFNGFHDAPTEEMKSALSSLLDEQDWMSDELKRKYLLSCSNIFGQVYSPAVNSYIRDDLHDCERHLQEIEKASLSRVEDNVEFRVIRDLEQNRMNLIFDGVPEVEIRNLLKRNGFRWSSFLGAWTRQLTQQAEKSLSIIKKEMGL